MTFDPTHDKLHDQPVTIGGDKSAAAWHPGSGPEAPHADLAAELRESADGMEYLSGSPWVGRMLLRAADALDARGNTPPAGKNDPYNLSAEDTLRMVRERDEARAERDALKRGLVAATERAEAAEAERVALAHVIEQAPHAPNCSISNSTWLSPATRCTCWKHRAAAIREEAGS